MPTGASTASASRTPFAFSVVRVFLGDVVEWDSPKGGEDRKVAIGRADGRILTVVYTWRNGARWIISARPAKRRERLIYEQRN